MVVVSFTYNAVQCNENFSTFGSGINYYQR